MNPNDLQRALAEIKDELERAISTAGFNGKKYENGQRAKEALIRSSGLILKIHEIVKQDLISVLDATNHKYTIHPPLGHSAPELKIAGFVKTKMQDVVVLFDQFKPINEIIKEGSLIGLTDTLGKRASETAIVIGVRSQLSSVAKNFDTLMERAFAETLNLRLRLPLLVMGEAYLIPVREYDDVLMRENKVAWKPGKIKIDKFINTFLSISGRSSNETELDLHKYERSALIITDFQANPPKIYLTTEELKKEGLLSENFNIDFSPLSPINFAEDLISAHTKRHDLHT